MSQGSSRIGDGHGRRARPSFFFRASLSAWAEARKGIIFSTIDCFSGMVHGVGFRRSSIANVGPCILMIAPWSRASQAPGPEPPQAVHGSPPTPARPHVLLRPSGSFTRPPTWMDEIRRLKVASPARSAGQTSCLTWGLMLSTTPSHLQHRGEGWGMNINRSELGGHPTPSCTARLQLLGKPCTPHSPLTWLSRCDSCALPPPSLPPS